MHPIAVAFMLGIIMIAMSEFGGLSATLVAAGIASFALAWIADKASLFRVGSLLVLAGIAFGVFQRIQSDTPVGRGAIIEVSAPVFSAIGLLFLLIAVAVFVLVKRYDAYVERNGISGTREEIRSAVEDHAKTDGQAHRALRAYELAERVIPLFFIAVAVVIIIEGLLGTGWEEAR